MAHRHPFGRSLNDGVLDRGTGPGMAITDSAEGRSPRSWLTVAEVCDELAVTKSSLYRWWASHEGPRYAELPGGQRRVRRDWLHAWRLGREAA